MNLLPVLNSIDGELKESAHSYFLTAWDDGAVGPILYTLTSKTIPQNKCICCVISRNGPSTDWIPFWMWCSIVLELEASTRRVARIWKRGGAILKEWEVCKRSWPEFSLLLNEFHTVFLKIETKFLRKHGNSKVFSTQNQVVSKKKKGFHRNWGWVFGRNPKFKGFFHPKSGGLQK